jgi:hypothetical protein
LAIDDDAEVEGEAVVLRDMFDLPNRNRERQTRLQQNALLEFSVRG